MDLNNLNRITLKEQKVLINNILKFIKEICDQNRINYYLAFGTLLGAVRHKGFIPWDDDIDIVMTRKDYNQFRTIISSIDTRYKLLDLTTNNNFDSPLPKVVDTLTILSQTQTREKEPIGVYVDIFILDNIPDNYISRYTFLTSLTIIQKAWSFVRYKRVYSKLSPLYYLYIFSTTLFSPRSIAKLLDDYSQKYNNCKTKCFGHNNHCSNRYKYIYKKSWFEEGTNVEFEGEWYRTAKDWDAFLTCLFGNYMELPPEEARVSNHIFEAYYLNSTKK